MGDREEEIYWLSVIAKSLAFMCMKNDPVKDKEKLAQARFLMGFGLKRAHAAAVLGTTDDSLRVLEARAKKTKEAKNVRGAGKIEGQ